MKRVGFKTTWEAFQRARRNHEQAGLEMCASELQAQKLSEVGLNLIRGAGHAHTA